MTTKHARTMAQLLIEYHNIAYVNCRKEAKYYISVGDKASAKFFLNLATTHYNAIGEATSNV